MIDSLSLWLPVECPVGLPAIEVGNLTLMPWKWECGTAISYKTNYKNLFISLTKKGGGRLSIHNSLHSFYHGTNGGRFTFEEAFSAVDQMEYELGISEMLDMNVSQISFGVNIIDPENLWQHVRGYKHQHFDRRKDNNGSKHFEQRCDLSDFRIKCYDKYFVEHNEYRIKLPHPTSRFEVESKKRRWFNGLGVNKLFDLFDKSESIKKKFVEMMKLIDMYEWDRNSLSTADLKRVAVLTDPYFCEALRRNSPASYKADRRRLNQLKREQPQPLKDKFISLIEDEVSLC